MNHPDIVSLRTTRANQVAKQMEVEGKENQQQRFDPADRCQTSNRHHQKRPEQAVKKEVMVPRIILANIRAESLIFEIDQETKPIQIWRQAGQTNP